MAVDPVGPLTGELPRVSLDDTGGPPRPRRVRPLRLSLKVLAAAIVLWFFVFPLIPGLRKAATDLRQVNPALLGLGLTLQILALFCYSLLTRAALGESNHAISRFRLFRIQMSTKALSSIVPGGSAAGSALGYRLMTLSGVQGADAGFALATAGLGSAVMLNVILWVGLIISIPARGVNALYGTAAVAGIIIMGGAAALVFGLMEGAGRAEKLLRWLARKGGFNEDRAGAAVRQVGGRLEDLAADRQLLVRVAFWAAANWVLDMASLWVFLRAFGPAADPDALVIAFGLANVLAVIPITPGGLGIIEGVLIPTLVGFGITRSEATLGVLSYRFAQYWFPILLGAVMYASLRFGPWSIKRRERLKGLRELAAETELNRESALDFAARFGRRRRIPEPSPTHPSQSPPVAPTDPMPRPDTSEMPEPQWPARRPDGGGSGGGADDAG
ncbi:MAG: flippase-like domain-containing protein [Actinobacteria bacterium]|nr:flippase-like domain-containing protein [Actinomycetota bacterium]